MKTRYTILLLLIFFYTKFNAQDTLNSINVENYTYQLYTNKNWKDLTAFGNKAINKGFNYYYLQIRIAIAYFEIGNYYAAEKHFKKALLFNSDDELVLEYLYYCYIYTSHFEEAKRLSKSFSKSLSEKLKINNKQPISYIIAEGGIKTTDSTRMFGNGNYFHLGIGHYVANSFSLFHGLTYYGQTFSDGAQVNGSLAQWQYFLKATVPLRNNWQVLPSFHILYKNTKITDPDYYAPLPPPPLPVPFQFPLKDTTQKANYYVGSLAVRKSINHFDFTLGSSVSNVFDNNQIQHFFTAAYAPLKKNKLIVGCTNYLYTEDEYVTTYYATYPFIEFNPTKKLSFNGSYLLNSNGKNVVENNGYIVNNSPDLTTSRWSFLASVAINKLLDVYGLYQFENKSKDAAYDQAGYDYNFNLFVIGLKIKP